MIVAQQQDAISADRYLGGLLMFVYRACRRYLVLMLVSAFAVGAIVQVFASRVAPVYGGRALVQLGAVDGKTVTKPTIAVAAIIAPSFRQRVVQAVGLQGGADSARAGIVFDSLSARLDNDDVIEVSVRATDEKVVRQALNAVVRLLDQKEEERRERWVADVKAQLVALDAYLFNLAKTRESLLARAKPSQTDSTSLETVLLLDLTSRNEQQQALVQARKLALQQRLEPDRTYPTKLVDDDFPISVVAGSAGRWRTTLFAVAITLLGFMLFALVMGRKTAGQS